MQLDSLKTWEDDQARAARRWGQGQAEKSLRSRARRGAPSWDRELHQTGPTGMQSGSEGDDTRLAVNEDARGS